MTTLSDHDFGRTINVGVGETITVRLRENPTTGSRWTVERADGLEQVASQFEDSGGIIGGTGARVFQFRASHAGTYDLALKNWREWEGDGSVIGRFTARIVTS